MANKFFQKLADSRELISKIFFLLSVGLAFVAGLLFVLLGDLVLQIGSTWLFGGILFTFGGMVCTVLSDIFKEKKVVNYVLRSVATALIVGFIVYLIPFRNAMLELYAKKPKELVKVDPVFISVMVVTVVATLSAIADLVLTVTLKEE